MTTSCDNIRRLNRPGSWVLSEDPGTEGHGRATALLLYVVSASTHVQPLLWRAFSVSVLLDSASEQEDRSSNPMRFGLFC